ncbi:MAG: peptidase M20 [Ignavibacteria bacterium GWF2_33_9]|nr:MAG: peptidase M20 [Ignavibacteria bacterium GWF2_33_9]
MNKVTEFIESNKEKNLNELIDFLRIPSISSETEHKRDVLDAANWLIENFKQIGINNTRLIETEGHPLVYAEYKSSHPNAKTILVYGHYDVQPVDPIELWESAPFEPFVKNGKIVARGSADDKGQVFVHLKAAEAYLATHGDLPVNLKFIIEGEEEAAESHIDEYIEQNPELLACDVVIVSDTEWFYYGMPSICYGLRGIAYFEMEVTGPNRDLHSGTFGGAVDNPIQVLSWMITQMKDKYGRITIPGFYDDVLELTPLERENFLKLPFNLQEYKADLDVREVAGEMGYTTLERVWARPSFDVNGMKGGYIGDGQKTVLPSKASAKFSFRLVPNQKAEDIIQKVVKYLEKLAPPTVHFKVRPTAGANPVLVDPQGPSIQACINSLEKAFGKEVVFMREGGSIPVVETFTKVLKSPVVLMGLGLPNDNIHSPNESFSLENFYGGILASAYFFDEFSK